MPRQEMTIDNTTPIEALDLTVGDLIRAASDADSPILRLRARKGSETLFGVIVVDSERCDEVWKLMEALEDKWDREEGEEP